MFYPWTDLYRIVNNSARILSIQINEKSAEIIAKRSRGTPRITNRFLRRIRDVAQVRGNDIITEEVARMGLEMLGVDENGLGDMDRKILETVIRYGGGPVGLKTIAVSVSEEEDTIEEVYESFLIQGDTWIKRLVEGLPQSWHMSISDIKRKQDSKKGSFKGVSIIYL